VAKTNKYFSFYINLHIWMAASPMKAAHLILGHLHHVRFE